MTSIFISYSSTDVEAGTRLRDLLDARGTRPSSATRTPSTGSPPGTRWAAELFSNLERADVIVFLASEASLASPWCHTELAVGVARGKHIVQVSQQKVPVHRVLADRQAMTPEPDFDRLVEALIANLSAVGFGPGDEFSWDIDRSPYPGLGRLDRDHAAVLFGRDAEVGACLQRLAGSTTAAAPRVRPVGEWQVVDGARRRPARDSSARMERASCRSSSPATARCSALRSHSRRTRAKRTPATLIADPKGLAFAVDRAVAGGASTRRVVPRPGRGPDRAGRPGAGHRPDDAPPGGRSGPARGDRRRPEHVPRRLAPGAVRWRGSGRPIRSGSARSVARRCAKWSSDRRTSPGSGSSPRRWSIGSSRTPRKGTRSRCSPRCSRSWPKGTRG